MPGFFMKKPKQSDYDLSLKTFAKFYIFYAAIKAEYGYRLYKSATQGTMLKDK